MDASNISLNHAKKILVYGPPFTGKTELVAKIAEKKRVHWFDLEEGIGSVLTSPRVQKAWLKNINYFKICDTPEEPLAIDVLISMSKGRVELCDTHGKLSCRDCTIKKASKSTLDMSSITNNDVIVIDSLTQLSNSAMNRAMKEDIAKYNYDASPDWDDYEKQGLVLNKLMSFIQALPCSVVCITHDTIVNPGKPNARTIPLIGTTNFSRNAPRFFDTIAYTSIVNGTFRVTAIANGIGGTLTGCRYNTDWKESASANLLSILDLETSGAK
jgi:nucleoside-triphosphatase THEP1